MADWIGRLRDRANAIPRFLGGRLKTSFYLYLAVIFSVVAIADVAYLNVVGGLTDKSFDWLVRHRLATHKADPEIVIVDINEPSLAALAKEYGRWPWPRQVLGEFLEVLNEQKPKAIVFDILFSDADVYNPDSDEYFNQAIAATDNTFFPMLRMPQEEDAKSRIKPGMIPGVGHYSDSPDPNATIAIVLPHFAAAIRSGRLGTHNIYPERDGIVRQYAIARDDYGWLLPSLPLRLAQKFGWPEPDADSILLNWRGVPFTYRYITFSDVYGDFQSKKRQRPPNEFSGKIVLIGSTAPSLFDIKATSMARQFPGVEVLATAIDNLKHADYLRVPKSRWPILLLTFLVIWGTAIAFVRHVALAKLDRVFGSAQIVLMAVTFASINFTSWYINLTAPITIGFIFFSIARVYAFTTERALERNVVAETYARAGSYRAVLLVINLSQNDRTPTASLVDKLRRQLEQLAKVERSVDQIKGEQKGVWSLLNGTLVVSWIHAVGDETVASQIAEDVTRVKNGLPTMLEAVRGRRLVSYAVIEHEEVLETGEHAGASWRRTLAHALGKAMAGPVIVKGADDV